MGWLFSHMHMITMILDSSGSWVFNYGDWSRMLYSNNLRFMHDHFIRSSGSSHIFSPEASVPVIAVLSSIEDLISSRLIPINILTEFVLHLVGRLLHDSMLR
jgi:hypothetical protein